MANIDLEAPGVSAARLRQALRQAAGRPVAGIQRRHARVLAGIDSLTAGGGSPWSSMIPSLATALKTRMGDGGVGLQFFDVLSAGYYAVAGTGGSLSNFIVDNPAWDSGARSHSLCGRGVAFTSASGGSSGLDPGLAWDFCRIFFELGAGGAFSAVNGGAGAEGVNVSDATHPTGTLCAVDLQSAAGNTALAVYGITGAVTLFSAEFINASGGVTVSNCGLSGSLLSEHASLNDGWARQWAAMLRPDVYMLNGGMNDRYTATPAGYSFLINKVVDRWQSAGSAVLLIRPNDSSDVASTYLAEYDRVLKATAALRGCAFLDDRTVLGAYAAASAAGYMSDLIHPSATGNALRGAAYAAEMM